MTEGNPLLPTLFLGHLPHFLLAKGTTNGIKMILWWSDNEANNLGERSLSSIEAEELIRPKTSCGSDVKHIKAATARAMGVLNGESSRMSEEGVPHHWCRAQETSC
jgi:hypothetical protein